MCDWRPHAVRSRTRRHSERRDPRWERRLRFQPTSQAGAATTYPPQNSYPRFLGAGLIVRRGPVTPNTGSNGATALSHRIYCGNSQFVALTSAPFHGKVQTSYIRAFKGKVSVFSIVQGCDRLSPAVHDPSISDRSFQQCQTKQLATLICVCGERQPPLKSSLFPHRASGMFDVYLHR